MRRLRAALSGDRALLAILAGAVLLMGLGIGWGLPNVESWSADDISPWVPLRLPKTYLFGWHKYPHLHPALSLFFYAPYMLRLLASGAFDLGCFPSVREECFSDPYTQLAGFILISRFLSLGMGVGIVFGIYQLSLRLHGDRVAARFAAAIASCLSVLVHYAHLGNLDVPQCFWFVLSLWFLAGIVKQTHSADYLGFGAAAGAALGTKEGIVGAYVLTCAFLYLLHLRRRASGSGPPLPVWRLGVDARLLGLGAALLGVYALASNPLNWSGFVRHWQEWLPSQPRMAGYHADFPGYPVFGQRIFASLRDGMSTSLLVLGGAGVLIAWQRHRAACVLLVPAASYLLFSILPAGYAPLRLLLPVTLLLTVFGGVMASRLWALGGWRRPLARALLALLLCHGFLQSLRGDLMMRADSRYAAEAWLEANVPKAARVGVLSQTKYLPRLAWLGYQSQRIELGSDGREALRSADPDVLILTTLYYPRLRRSHGPFLDALLAGELGYSLRFESDGEDPLDFLPERPGVAKVSPGIRVLGRTSDLPKRVDGGR